MTNFKAKIIDGIYHAFIVEKAIKEIVEVTREHNNKTPHIVTILVGENPSSRIYVKRKLKKAKELGIKGTLLEFQDNTTEVELINKIQELNKDSSINGILVQLPLPNHINSNEVLESIDASKDVDGLTSYNQGLLLKNSSKGFYPCTALGCLYLIKQQFSDLNGINALIIGRSNLVGKPLANLLLNNNATITIAHSKTKNLNALLSSNKIIISAVGKPNLVKSDCIQEDALIIDVGISKVNNKIVGDVDFDNLKDKVMAITPVPGGVGPMTIAFLMYNTLKAFLKQNGLNQNIKNIDI